jgi:hypothetical protein
MAFQSLHTFGVQAVAQATPWAQEYHLQPVIKAVFNRIHGMVHCYQASLVIMNLVTTFLTKHQKLITQ